jgi:hypothetical protein
MQTIKKIFKSLLAITISGGLVLAAVPALALQMPGYPQSSQNPAQNAPAGTNKSYNWAGYTVNGNNFTSVTGTWNIPNISSSPSPSADATWVGIGGVTTQDLIQAGTQAIDQNGQIQYQAWYETLPQNSQTLPLTVNAGDSISASITQQNAGQWLINLRDNTSGQNYQTTVQYNSSLSSAEWIEEMPMAGNGFIPLDNFGTVNFSGATTVENSQTLTAAQADAQPMSMLNSNNQDLADASALGSDGASFSVTRTSVAANSSSGFSGFGRGGYHRRGRGVNGFGSMPQPSSVTIPTISIPGGNGMQIFRLFGLRPGSFTVRMGW